MNMRTVSARFPGSTKLLYSYYIPEGDEPKPGDLLLTSVSWSTEKLDDEGFEVNAALAHTREDIAELLIAQGKLATVVKIDAAPNPKASKFYVQLISIDAVKVRREQNQQLVAKVVKQRDITAKLDQLLAQEDQRLRYARLASTNPEAAALLAELEGQPVIEAQANGGSN